MYLFLGTSGCHLCEQVRGMLDDLKKNVQVVVTEIDIAEDIQWQNDYALIIPVILHHETGRELGWPFTQDELYNFIRELNYDPRFPN
jgi:hypothetical protein